MKCLVMLHLVLQDCEQLNRESLKELLDCWLQLCDKMMAKHTKQ